MKILENEITTLDEFIRLNEQWITTYFELEEADKKLAENPVLVIEQGGYIFSLVEGKQVLGVCALFNKGSGVYELARMAVAPEAQGRGLGNLLIQHSFKKLEELDAIRVYLVSNTRLEPAISLYKKHGFQVTSLGQHPDYLRANITMEKTFT